MHLRQVHAILSCRELTLQHRVPLGNLVLQETYDRYVYAPAHVQQRMLETCCTNILCFRQLMSRYVYTRCSWLRIRNPFDVYLVNALIQGRQPAQVRDVEQAHDDDRQHLRQS